MGTAEAFGNITDNQKAEFINKYLLGYQRECCKITGIRCFNPLLTSGAN